MGFALLLGLLVTGGLALAQGTARAGRVTGKADQTGIPGVNVTVKGTTRGVVISVTGDFSITVPDNAILVFAFIGYTSQEVTVRSQFTINIALEEDATSLSEVVVTG